MYSLTYGPEAKKESSEQRKNTQKGMDITQDNSNSLGNAVHYNTSKPAYLQNISQNQPLSVACAGVVQRKLHGDPGNAKK